MNKEQLPLHGKKVCITRSRHQANEFIEQVTKLGGEPIVIPLIQFKEIYSKKITDTIQKLSRYSWIVFTSTNGVSFFSNLLRENNVKIPASIHIAVVGKKTKKITEQLGWPVQFTPSKFTGEQLAKELTLKLDRTDKVLVVKGNLASSIIFDRFTSLQIETDELVVYETTYDQSSSKELISHLAKQDLDVLTFTSPSTLAAFVSVVDSYPWEKWIEACYIACIGPVTVDAAKRYNIHPKIIPKEYTMEGLILAITDFYQFKK